MNTSAGRIRDDDIEELRRKVSIVDVASDYMQLKRAGRLFKALCPFHSEKTPSFSIDPAKQLWHCFGCSEGGDTIQLVRKLENLSFVETVERLAKRFGLELRYEKMSESDRRAHRRRLRLVEAHREAVAFYHRLLMGTAGADARAYLKGRSFTKVSVEAFRVGLSPGGWDELCVALLKKGFGESELVEAGLARRREGGGLIDYFRGRLMFPIFDLTGDPVAFGARKLDQSDGPKYLNSAESPIYKKGHLLYGLHVAKGDIVKASRALIVEGYTDVIALHQAGIRDAVATCGTALGLDHLRTLQRFTQNIVLSLDSDEAGGTAAERTYEQLIGEAQGMGLSLKVLIMPPGDDPADSVTTLGPAGFGELVNGAIPLLEFVLRREAERYQVGDPEVRARALGAGIRLLAKTDNEVVRNEYVRRLSSWIGVDANAVFVELARALRTGAATTRGTAEVVLKRSSGLVKLEREALKLAIQHPTLVKEHVGEVGLEHFSVPAHRALWQMIANGDDPETLAEDRDAHKAYVELAVQPPEGDVNARLIADIFTRLKEMVLTRQIEEKKVRLQQLNPEGNVEEYHARFSELIELEAAKRRLTEQGEER